MSHAPAAGRHTVPAACPWQTSGGAQLTVTLATLAEVTVPAPPLIVHFSTGEAGGVNRVTA
jgi:hypothetical protein